MYESAEKGPTGSDRAPAQTSAAWARPRGIERWGIGLFILCALAFGAIVEMRSAFLHARMTDLDVYLRAAWAVRTGHDPYTVTDDRGLHYHYPPLFAIVLIPLADAPHGYSRSGMLPYATAVVLWYVLNLLFVAFAANHLANALERAAAEHRSGIPPPGSRSWWSLRLLPALICIGPLGVALERGQADLLLLALLCAMICAIMAGRSGAAGWCLAGAICLKLFPAYLLIYPLWRRDLRLIASCALGLVLGLVVIPAAFFGPATAISYAREWNHVLIQPALLNGTDRSRAGELLDINATDSQSFVALVHRWYNLDETLRLPRSLRSRPLEAWATPAHWAISIFLTALTLLAARWRPRGSPLDEELFLGSLAIIMVLSSPVSHLHYVNLAVPLAMGLVMVGRGDAVYPGRKWIWLFAAVAACGVLPLIPGLEVLRDLGLEGFAALALWGVGTTALRRSVQPAGLA
ncbi:MAG TPA: glycosyltransferase family 87 protein [Candidatus Binataceae bacterium]|jgi:alpha-1,2-mannosyltransferase|nr:glycosyltransferase family 87 protein [Candidatus Binataceae bacterium]